MVYYGRRFYTTGKSSGKSKAAFYHPVFPSLLNKAPVKAAQGKEIVQRPTDGRTMAGHHAYSGSLRCGHGFRLEVYQEDVPMDERKAHIDRPTKQKRLTISRLSAALRTQTRYKA